MNLNRLQELSGSKEQTPSYSRANILEDTKFWKYLEKEGNFIKLYHYSNQKDLKVIDPNKFGKNLYTNRDVKAWGANRTFFYTHKNGYQQDVLNVSNMTLYEVLVPANKIYPLNEDPLDYSEHISPIETPNFYQRIKDGAEQDGFMGLIYGNHKNAIVILWDKVKVVHEENKFDNSKNIEYKLVGELPVLKQASVFDDYVATKKIYGEIYLGTDKKYYVKKSGTNFIKKLPIKFKDFIIFFPK